MESPASTTTYSAWLARLSVNPITSSPAANPVTPSPTSSTTPARSLPCPDGNVAGHRFAGAVEGAYVSASAGAGRRVSHSSLPVLES